MTESALRRLGAWFGPPGSGLRRFRIALVAALGLLCLWLVGPYDPWSLPGAPSLFPRRSQSLLHTVLVATWWTALVNAVVCAALLLTSKLWARALPATPGASDGRARRGPGRVAWLLLLGAAALAGALRWPTIDGSVSWDEARTLRKVIVGKRDLPPTGTEPAVFEPAPWLSTFFEYRAPTNHVAYSVAARLSLAGWRALSGAPPHAFRELPLRLPALVAALASVVMLGLLVHELGFPRAAPAAALLLAIHPWHVHYGAEGRGYSFVVLFTITGAWLLLRALRGGHWRDWLGYGACQLLLLWTFPLAVHVSFALFAAALAAIWLGDGPRRELRWLQTGRLAVANLLAAMLFLQLMAPCIIQSLYFESDLLSRGEVAGGELAKLWTYLAIGLGSRTWLPSESPHLTLGALFRAEPWRSAVLFGLLPALVAFGIGHAWSRGRARERAVLLGLASAVPLLLLHAQLQGFWLIDRFAFHGVVPVVALFAIGFEGALALWSPLRERPLLLAAGLALGLLAFEAFVLPGTRMLLQRRESPLKEVAERLSGECRQGGALCGGVGLAGRVAQVYLPALQPVTKYRGLARLCGRARSEGRPLLLVYGLDAERKRSRLFDRIHDAHFFDPVARFDGLEADMTYHVVRYTGVPLLGLASGEAAR